jgi:signal transduction histidine kinase
MFSRWRSFQGRVLGGYVIAILPLTAAMAVTVAHIEEITAAETQRLRSEQNEISLAEQLRWSADLLVSAGRGYLITGSPDLLVSVRRHEVEFDRGVRALEQQTLSTTGAALLEGAERAAHEFRSIQASLLADRSSRDLVERFERELQSPGAALSRSLAQLIEHKEQMLDAAYDENQRKRRDLVIWTFALLGTFTTVGLALAWHFATRLARAYGQEKRAVAASEKALRQRDELMGILAHDLRNPLNSIALKAGVLRHAMAGSEFSRHADSIGTITAGMAELVDAMLDLSTIDSGHLELDARPLDVARLLDDVTEIYQSLAGAKHVRLERACSESELLILADRKRVVQVLSNLLGNAIKATPSNGSIGVEAEDDGAMVCFSVWDTGPGIAEEHRPYIFERRWKHEREGMTGTGLGLFIAKGIVDAHGGRIWNEPSARGAVFRFTVPRLHPARGATEINVLSGRDLARDSSSGELR